MPSILLQARPPRPRPGPRLFAFASTLHLRPGGRVRFVLRVSNGDVSEQPATFGLLGLPDAWKATLSHKDVLVPARGHRLVALRIDAPEAAELGERVTLQIMAGMAGHEAFLDLEVVVDRHPRG